MESLRSNLSLLSKDQFTRDISKIIAKYENIPDDVNSSVIDTLTGHVLSDLSDDDADGRSSDIYLSLSSSSDSCNTKCKKKLDYLEESFSSSRCSDIFELPVLSQSKRTAEHTSSCLDMPRQNDFDTMSILSVSHFTAISKVCNELAKKHSLSPPPSNDFDKSSSFSSDNIFSDSGSGILQQFELSSDNAPYLTPSMSPVGVNSSEDDFFDPLEWIPKTLKDQHTVSSHSVSLRKTKTNTLCTPKSENKASKKKTFIRSPSSSSVTSKHQSETPSKLLSIDLKQLSMNSPTMRKSSNKKIISRKSKTCIISSPKKLVKNSKTPCGSKVATSKPSKSSQRKTLNHVVQTNSPELCALKSKPKTHQRVVHLESSSDSEDNDIIFVSPKGRKSRHLRKSNISKEFDKENISNQKRKPVLNKRKNGTLRMKTDFSSEDSSSTDGNDYLEQRILPQSNIPTDSTSRFSGCSKSAKSCRRSARSILVPKANICSTSRLSGCSKSAKSPKRPARRIMSPKPNICETTYLLRSHSKSDSTILRSGRKKDCTVRM